MSKKLLIVLFTMFSFLIALWIWTIFISKNSIIIGGSTSVNSFMQRTTKQYYKDTNSDFVFNSTGSQAGVIGVEKEMYAVGFISKKANTHTLSKGNEFDKDLKVNEENINWDKLNFDKKYYYSYTFALDAIAIIYNPPSWWNDELDLKLNFKSDDDSNNLLKHIYEKNISWSDFANKIENTNKYNGNDSIIKYTREDGSGTRSAFSELAKVKNTDSANVGNSNGTMLENISTTKGSIGYVSYGFIKSINKNSNVRVAGFSDYKLSNNRDNNDSNLDIPWKFDSKENKWKLETKFNSNEELIRSDDFKFKRPFIAIFKGKSKKLEVIKKFLSSISTEHYKDIYKVEGLVPVSKINDIKE